MTTNLQRKLALAAQTTADRRSKARLDAYEAATTQAYRETVGRAILGIGAESPRYVERMRQRNATKH